MGCPSVETLGLLADEDLAAERREALVEHLEGCDGCRILVVELVRGTASTAAATVDGPRRMAAAVASGSTIDRYVIDRPLGAGGMGIVYLAHDPELDRPIALKLLRSSSVTGGERLRREARSLAQLAHPNVVAVHDVGEHDGRIFVAMERVDGADLRAWLRERRRTWREIVDSMIAAARGLEAAHAAGLLHRDIKPDNILVGKDGRVRVSDFGLATSIGDASDPNSLAGTPAYMSPERVGGGDDDVSSDLWSFSVTLYEALYDQRPFAGTELAELLVAVAAVDVEPPPAGAKVPGWLRRVVARGLARDPAARWPSIAALRSALERGRHRRRTVLIAAGVSGVVAAAVIVWSLTRAPAAGPSCDAAGEIPDAIWGPARREAIVTAFSGSENPAGAAVAPRAVAEVDAWMGDWREAGKEACEGARAGGQSAELTDRRLACLDARLHAVDTLLERWETGAPEAIDLAPGAIDMLAPLAACAPAVLLAGPRPPADPEVAARVDALRIDLLRAQGLQISGDRVGAVKMVESLIAEATELDDPAFLAEAYLVAAGFASNAIDYHAEERALRDAIRAAELAQHDRVKVEACAQLVMMLGQRGRFDESEHWAEYASAALERIGSDDRLEELLGIAIGVARGRQGRHAEASAAFRKAIEAARRAHGDRTTQVAIGREYLAGSLDAEGKTAESDAERAAAAAIHTELYGDDGAAISMLFDTRRDGSLEAGDLETTIRLDTERLRLMTALFPSQLTQHAEIEAQLGYDYVFARRSVEAIEHHSRAVALRDRAGDRSVRLVVSLSEIGSELIELRRADEALPYLQRAIEVATALGDAAEDDLATARAALGRAHLALADPVSAREPLEQALAYRVNAPQVPDAQRGGNRFDLARALIDVDPRRAHDLAETARIDFERALASFEGKTGIWDMVRSRVKERQDLVLAWLAEHPKPP